MTNPLTDALAEANDADIAEQSLPVDQFDEITDYPASNGEADIGDLLEQRQSVPSGDEDYDHE